MSYPALLPVEQLNVKTKDKYKFQIFETDELDEATVSQLHFSVSNQHFLQDIEWLKASINFHKYAFAVTFTDDLVCAYSIIEIKNAPLKIGKILRINRGPIFSSIESLEQHLSSIVNYFNDDIVAWIEISPFIHDPSRQVVMSRLLESHWKPLPKMREMYESSVILELSDDIDKIRAGFRRSLKTQLNKAKKLDMSIIDDLHSSYFDDFIRMHNDMATQRGLAPIDEMQQSYIKKLQNLDQKNIIFLGAILEQQLLGGILLIRAGNRYIYEWGVSSDTHKKLPVSHYLHWEGIQRAKRFDAKVYDFGGYWQEKGDNDPINRFKTGFSKKIEKYVPEHNYIVSPARTRMIKLLMKLRELVK